MAERESLLGIDLETVATFTNNPEEAFYSRDYLRGVDQHLRRYQPRVAKLLTSQPIFTPEGHKFFRAGALSTYDLITQSDSEQWRNCQIDKQTIAATKRTFLNSAITTRSGTLWGHDKRIVSEMEWFYTKVTANSPRYGEWLQLRVARIPVPQAASEFIYGSLLTATPFYLTRERDAIRQRLAPAKK